MSGGDLSLLVSGWRFVPHSHAVVSQFECLELLRRAPPPRLYFEDTPYINPEWRPMTGLFDEAEEAALAALGPAPAGAALDGELRFGAPYDFLRPSRARRTTVFGTAEFLTVQSGYLPGGIGLREAQQRHGIAILTCSNWSREGFIRGGAPAESVSVLPLGFDPAVFRPADEGRRAEIRADLGWGGDDFVFLHVGAMTANKGLKLLLQAFAALLEKRPRARLLLKGMDGLYASNRLIDEQVHALAPQAAQAVASRLSYVGQGLAFADMARLYQSADCYVSPYIAEGFNMPVLEAAACGLPVICTAGGPTDDFVTDDFALRIASKLRPVPLAGLPDAMGLLPDREHLLQLMTRAMDDDAYRAAARRAGPAYVGERYTWRKVVDRLLPMVTGRGQS